MTSRKMGQITPVALMVGSGEIYTGVWWGNMKERKHLEDLGIDR
jgi:predicted amino acid racemase